ncbi:Sjogren's syndrome/scleroderma autoantigen 1 family protein [Thermococcus sp.]
MALSDEEIRKIITPLLLSGAKMLDKHCPKCGSPLFELNGKVFCPVCEHRKKQRKADLKGIEEILMEKLKVLANNLPDDIEKLEKHLRVMEKIIEILERYKKLEGEE